MSGKRLRHYNNDQWIIFRNEVIERDGDACTRCGGSKAGGLILQAHHKIYLPGKMPWEYDHSDCETLCKGCHAAEHGKIPPKIGWTCLGEDDLEDLIGQCEYCGTEIRYVFYVHHPSWEPMGVGTYCCDHLTGTQLASDHLESLHRFISRQSRFLSSPRWKERVGTCSIRQKGIDVNIQTLTAGFRICMNGKDGRRIFSTIDEAKETAFEVIENGIAAAYLNKGRNLN